MTVSPDPSSCSRNQSQMDDYICSGLTLGTRYNITIAAINCGDQDGASLNLVVGPPPQGIIYLACCTYYKLAKLYLIIIKNDRVAIAK